MSVVATVVVWFASTRRRIARIRVSGSQALARARETSASIRASSTPRPEALRAASTQSRARAAGTSSGFGAGACAGGAGAGEGGAAEGRGGVEACDVRTGCGGSVSLWTGPVAMRSSARPTTTNPPTSRRPETSCLVKPATLIQLWPCTSLMPA